MAVANASSMTAPTNVSNAALQAWASELDRLIQDVGWVETGDTGATDPATWTVPGSNNTAAGFRVYKIDDAYASSHPIYVKMEGGRAGNSTSPTTWWTIGTGSDGSGTITGVMLARTQVSNGTGQTATPFPSYASSDGSSLNITQWVGYSGTSGQFTFRLERRRNGDNSVDPSALTFTLAPGIGSTISSYTLSHGAAPASSSYAANPGQLVTFPYSVAGTVITGPTTAPSMSPDGQTAPVFPIPHAAPGVWPWVSENMVAIATPDAGALSLIVAAPHGTDRVYRAFPTVNTASMCDIRSSGVSVPGHAISAMLWDEV